MDSLLLKEVILHQKQANEEIQVEQFGTFLRISAKELRSVRLYDLQGKLLYEAQYRHADQQSRLSLNYNSGGNPHLVILRVQTETGEFFRRILLK